MEIHGLNNTICTLEAQGLANCFNAYANISGEEIMEIGFNANTGYVYIALENGISICSQFGNDIEYLVTNFEDGEESFFETYEEAEKFYETLND
jgi:hypothetical protein